jgi:hypothetical protein
MKLILQIAFGVFLGTLGAQVTSDIWREQQTELRRAKHEKTRLEQAERIRKLFVDSQKPQGSGNTKAPDGFIPDDAQTELKNQN